MNNKRIEEVSPVEEDNFYIDILPVFMKEVLEEVGHRLVGDVATHDDVPGQK